MQKRGKRRRGGARETREEILDLLRLGGLMLELDGFMWLRVVLSSIRKRVPGRLGVVTLVLAIALRFLPFLGAAVCGRDLERARAARVPVAVVRVEPLRPPADRSAAAGTGALRGSGEEVPVAPRQGRSGKAFGATRWPEAILPKEVRLPEPAARCG